MVQIEFTTTIKPTKLDKIFFWLFSKMERMFCRNKYGMVSGWWQTWRLDYWAWKSVVKAFPTRFMWLTSEYYVNFKKQLGMTDVKINVKGIVCYNEVKKNRKCQVELEITSNGMVFTQANFIFVEKEHNYCVDSALKK